MSTELPTASASRSRAALIIRIMVSLVLLGVLFATMPSIDASKLVPDPTLSAAVWLGAALAFTLASVVLSTLRWQQVLHALDIHVPVPQLLSHYFAGQFVANVLPTTIGGDVLRVSRLARDCRNGTASFASVVLERLSGWLVLPALTLGALAFNPGLRSLGRASRLAAGVAMITLVLFAIVLALATSRRLGGKLVNNDGLSRFIGAVHLGLDRFRRHPASAMGVVVAGFAHQMALMLAALCAAAALDIPQMGITATLAFIPAVAVLQVLPIAISGLGVRESALVVFLTPLGVPHEKAVALGLLLYLLNLVVSLLGTPAFAVGGRHRGSPDPVR